jgi:hypothetical protein
VGEVNQTTALFRQINKDNPHTHHDALEFPDGQIVLLTDKVRRNPEKFVRWKSKKNSEENS